MTPVLEPSVIRATYACAMARATVWVMRLVGVAACAYVAVLAAGNIPNALNMSGHVPGTRFTNWGVAFVLSAGVVIAGGASWYIVRASTPGATLRRLVVGAGALGLWYGAFALTSAAAA